MRIEMSCKYETAQYRKVLEPVRVAFPENISEYQDYQKLPKTKKPNENISTLPVLARQFSAVPRAQKNNKTRNGN